MANKQGRKPNALDSSYLTGAKRVNRAAQFMPFAALKGYYDLVHQQEISPEPQHQLTDEECLALSQLMAQLQKGDVVRVRWYHEGGYVISEGAVTQVDAALRQLWLVRKPIPFDAIDSVEKL